VQRYKIIYKIEILYSSAARILFNSLTRIKIAIRMPIIKETISAYFVGVE
jgi:hypothetical protein